MDSPNTHPIPDEEEEEVLTDIEEPTDNSDASDYEWEREMQSIWREFDECKAELDAEKEKERLEKEAAEAREAEKVRANQDEAAARSAEMDSEEENEKDT